MKKDDLTNILKCFDVFIAFEKYRFFDNSDNF